MQVTYTEQAHRQKLWLQMVKKGCEGHQQDVVIWVLMIRWTMEMMATAMCQAQFQALCMCKLIYSLQLPHGADVTLSPFYRW